MVGVTESLVSLLFRTRRPAIANVGREQECSFARFTFIMFLEVPFA